MIKFQDVSKVFSKEIGIQAHTAIDNLSFTAQRGETLGLVGANGAGKSTSIKLLMDFIRPSNGNIELFNDQPRSILKRKSIGYLPEVANFPSNLSVYDLLKFTAKVCGLSKEVLYDRSKKLLLLLDLWEVRKQPLRIYSKGMQQRANFAIALINNPELLILDEPMSGLDPMARKKIIDLIFHLKNEGKTIVFCSHILEDIDRLVDKVLLLHKGKKIFFGKPEELKHQERESSFTDAFVSRVRSEDLKND